MMIRYLIDALGGQHICATQRRVVVWRIQQAGLVDAIKAALHRLPGGQAELDLLELDTPIGSSPHPVSLSMLPARLLDQINGWLSRSEAD